ncbi:MAG: zf-HC2 domain-containing protein, partial [Holophaga sp.]|nr:zf-HC2 domain-containing protein [Holophaga sp.]
MGAPFTCEDTVAALSDYRDGILPLAAFLKIRAHLFNCPGCRTVLATLRALPALAAAALAPG